MTLHQNEDKKLLSMFPPQMKTTAMNSGSSQAMPAPSDMPVATDLFALLGRVLQSTLDVNEICRLFFQHVQPLVTMDSLSFNSVDARQAKIHCGNKSAHSCHYQLVIDQNDIGKISFTRRKRFTENEMMELESLMSVLIYPLRNGLLYQEALRTAMTDPLTGLGSRVAMENSLSHVIGLSQRRDQPFALLLVDIDKFKSVNDTYGHTAGDLVLRAIARGINSACRQTDQGFRYGGEEFLIILDETEEQTAITIAERIRKNIEKLETHFDTNTINATVSIGIATVKPGDTQTTLFDRADKALYFAKRGGRNRVINSNSMEKLSKHLLECTYEFHSPPINPAQ